MVVVHRRCECMDLDPEYRVHENAALPFALSEFASNALANFVGGGLATLVLLVLIEHRLHLRTDRRKRDETTFGILEAVRDELKHNAVVAEGLLEHLPEGSLPYARFETGGWGLVTQIAGGSGLQPDTVQKLLNTYVRAQSVNEQHGLLLDLTYGSTGAVAYLIAATSPEHGQAGFKRFEERREDLRKRLEERVKDLAPQLAESTRLVEAELRARERSAPDR
jgi:hypothetical protein